MGTRVGTGVIGTTTADGNGNWSFDYTGTPLTAGSYSFTATAKDAAARADDAARKAGEDVRKAITPNP